MSARTIVRHATSARAIALVALVIAAAPSAYAAIRVTSSNIVNGTIRSVDIKNGEVKTADIGTGEVRTADIGAAQVTGAKLSAGTITADKLAAGVAGGDGQWFASNNNTVIPLSGPFTEVLGGSIFIPARTDGMAYITAQVYVSATGAATIECRIVNGGSVINGFTASEALTDAGTILHLAGTFNYSATISPSVECSKAGGGGSASANAAHFQLLELRGSQLTIAGP